jgi:uncharacterized protein YceK
MTRFVIYDIASKSKYPYYIYYPATRGDFSCMSIALNSDEQGVFENMVIFIFCGIDIPFSLTTDTLCLPYDFYMIQKCKNQKDNSTKADVHQQEKVGYKNKTGI